MEDGVRPAACRASRDSPGLRLAKRKAFTSFVMADRAHASEGMNRRLDGQSCTHAFALKLGTPCRDLYDWLWGPTDRLAPRRPRMGDKDLAFDFALLDDVLPEITTIDHPNRGHLIGPRPR